MIKPRATEDSTGAVAGVLEVGKQRMETPGRIPTTSDARAVRSSKFQEHFGDRFLILARLAGPELLEGLVHDEEILDRMTAGLARDGKASAGATRFLHLVFRDVSLEDTEPLRTLLDLQQLLDLEVITVQFGSAPSPEDVLRAFDYARSWAKRRGVETPLMPVVPPLGDRAEASKLLDALMARGVEALGLDLRGSFPYQTLRALEDLKGRHPEVWVHAFQAHPKVRLGGALLPAAQAMVLPLFGVDTSSRWVVPPPPVPVKKEKVNRFDPAGWGILKWEEHRGAYGGDLRCRCPACHGKDLEAFFAPAEREVLNLAKVHDHFAQIQELGAAARHIGGEGYGAALKEHRYSRTFLDRLGVVGETDEP